MTVFAIVPLYCLHTLGRIIYEVLNYRLPLNTADQLDFSNTVVCRTLFFAIDCILIHFFVHPKLWIGPGDQILSGQAGYPPQSPYGVQPPAQFTGQWGFTGQSSPSLPSTNGPPQGFQAPDQPGMAPYPQHHVSPQTNPAPGGEDPNGAAGIYPLSSDSCC
jgi:hypothetical protein